MTPTGSCFESVISSWRYYFKGSDAVKRGDWGRSLKVIPTTAVACSLCSLAHHEHPPLLAPITMYWPTPLDHGRLKSPLKLCQLKSSSRAVLIVISVITVMTTRSSLTGRTPVFEKTSPSWSGSSSLPQWRYRQGLVCSQKRKRRWGTAAERDLDIINHSSENLQSLRFGVRHH